MEPRAYYRILTDPKNDISSASQDLQVNCAGYSVYSEQDNVAANTARSDYYMLFLEQGSVKIISPSVERDLCPGDMIIFHPGTHFEYYKPCDEKMVYYWVHFTGRSCEDLLSKCGLSADKIISVNHIQSVGERFKMLYDSFLTRDSLFDINTAHILAILLIAVGRYASLKPDPGSKPASKQLRTSLSYIHTHLSGNISIKQLAQMEYLSVSRYSAVFKELYGLSPQKYIIFTKLSYSCELLRNTDMSIQEVSSAVGYNDTQYFSRIFSKYIGTPPSSFKDKI